jgi:hypothetical protein
MKQANPSMVLIVGSSLSNKQLVHDINALSGGGVPVYIVNPTMSPNFKEIKAARLIQSSAEELSQMLYAKLRAAMQV